MSTYQVFVTINARNITIEVENYFLVSKLKELVADKEGIEPESQRLIFGGKELRDELTLAEYNLQQESTIILLLRMIGGSQETKFFKINDANETLGFAFLKDVKSSTKPCMITKEDSPSVPRAELPCGHAISPWGMTGYVRSLVDKGKFLITCPEPKNDKDTSSKPELCSREWEYPLCRKIGIFSPAECRDYEVKLSTHYVNKSIGAVTCPKCTGFMVPDDKLMIRMVCPYKKCGYVFCCKCLLAWAGGSIFAKSCGNRDCLSMIAAYNQILKECPRIEIIFGTVIKGVPSRRVCPRQGCKSQLYSHDGGQDGGCRNVLCVQCNKRFCFACLKLSDTASSVTPCSSGGPPCPVAAVQQLTAADMQK